MDKQLGLFGGGEPTPQPPDIELHVESEDRELAVALPRFVRFGTSSWSFPGWRGIVWKGDPSESDLARAGLKAYARHPLFRAVSLDRSFYRPLRAEDLADYAVQLDSARAATPTLPRFRVVSKVWDEITTAVYPSHPRSGARAGMKNPHFLDAERFVSEVFAPYARTFGIHAGPFVFELTPMPRGTFDERAFVAKVEDFVARLPVGPRWAFELRNADLFGRRWLDMLRASGAAHVFNYWTAMPPLRAQLAAGAAVGAFVVVRLMLPPFARYESRKAELAPFDRIVSPQLEMRDDVLAILARAVQSGSRAVFILVNNKAEGSAPLTIRELARRTVRELRY